MRSLNIFPVSYKVQGKTIAIVGGGVEALNKARLAVKTSAKLRVFSKTFTADFSSLDLELVDRLPTGADMADVALIFIEGEADGAEQAIADAKALGIPVNVIDRPELCDFYTPAIVDRAPISVAISSDGLSPVLSRIIRAKIEAILSPEIGALARIGGELRGRVATLLSKTGARRFYDELAGGRIVETALTQGLPAGRRAALRLLDGHVSGHKEVGVIWQMGAGPGAEDLLTLRAHRLLQQADVIVHDARVPAMVVQMGRRDARVIRVENATGEQFENGNKINDLLIELAKQNLKIARLHRGDLAGSGAYVSECAALDVANIEYVLVPGVADNVGADNAGADNISPNHADVSFIAEPAKQSMKTA